MKGIAKSYKGVPKLKAVLKTRHKNGKCEAQRQALMLCHGILQWQREKRMKFKGNFEAKVAVQEERRRAEKKLERKRKRQKKC